MYTKKSGEEKEKEKKEKQANCGQCEKREDLINLDNYAKLREYIAVQLSEEDTHVPTFADLISISASSSPKALSPKFEFSTFPTRQWITPVFSPNTPDSPQHSFLPLLFDFHDLPALQVEPGYV